MEARLEKDQTSFVLISTSKQYKVQKQNSTMFLENILKKGPAKISIKIPLNKNTQEHKK